MTATTATRAHARLRPLGADSARWASGFWGDVHDRTRDVTIPQIWSSLSDPAISAGLTNFRIAAGLESGEHAGPPFMDGDFYKWLEAAIARLETDPDPELAARIEQIAQLIASVQRDDGYLHTPTIISSRNHENAIALADRFNFETYNLGHLITAGVRHYEVTGSTTLLDAARKAAGFLEDLASPSPLVLLDAPGLAGYAPSVNLDVASGARELAAHLAEAGHREVAYVDSVTGTETYALRREAFLDEAAARGIRVGSGRIISTTIDVGAAAAAFANAWPTWQREGVTAVVCGTDTHAYGVLQEARVAGVRIPEELAVAGFDDLPYSATSNPGLTSVHLPATPLGLKAGEQLRALMEGRPLEQAQLTLASSLVVRGSTS